VGSVTPGELEALGLYDPDEEHAAERLALLEYLLELGATVEELVEAGPALPAVASTVVLRGGKERLTQGEAAARAGVTLGGASRLWRAAGFPDPGPDARVCTEEDVEALRVFQAGAELLGEDVVLQVARVIGSSMARVADAAIAAFLVNVGEPSLAQDPSGLTLARANAEAVTLLRQAAGVMDVILRRHVEVLQRPLVVGNQDTQQLTVGFTDLVGSTALAQQLSIQELGVALAEFDERASDVIIGAGGRVVKLIGDEVMWVVADPEAGCAIALGLAVRFSDHPRLPPVRGGLASGAVLSRDGDHFGPVVNLAARAVKLAAPGTVLASPDVQHSVQTYRFESIGPRPLKGFDELIEFFQIHQT
jgi:adenylate cyclase